MIAFAPRPLAYFSGSLLTAAIALQSQQAVRRPLFAIFLALIWLFLGNLHSLFPNPDHADCFGVWTMIYSLHIANALFIEKYIVPLPHSPTPTTTTFPGRASSTSSSWNWVATYKLLYNLRWVNTRNVAPNVATHRKRTSRNTFLVEQLAYAALIFTLNHCWTLAVNNGPWAATDFLSEKDYALRRLWQVTFRENAIRLFFIIHFVWSGYAMLAFVHRIHAFFAVLIGIDEPQDWPPLFGSIKETYTLRRFWSKFWHRIVYRAYDGHGRLFSQKVLGLKPGTPRDRIVRNGMIFFISGCAHAVVTLRLGFTCGYWEDVWWYVGCFLAICLEEAFFISVTSWLGKGVWERNAVRTWGKLMGYFWVAAWFWWSLPKNLYPKIRCMPPALLPDEVIDAATMGMVEKR